MSFDFSEVNLAELLVLAAATTLLSVLGSAARRWLRRAWRR